MQLSSIQSKLSWLSIPALALAATRPDRRSTPIGTGQLKLLTPEHLNVTLPHLSLTPQHGNITLPQMNLTAINRVAFCKHDDPYPPYDPPFQFTSSLNYTFPDTPAISESSLRSLGLEVGDGDYPFDCFLEIPGGVVVFEIKGDIDSHLRLAFEVWLSVLVFNYEVGVFTCDLLDLEKDPCAFNIDKRYFKGQGGVYPKEDPDPDYIDLCAEIHGVVKIPYTRIQRKVDFDKCFYKFPRNDEVAKNLIA